MDRPEKVNEPFRFKRPRQQLLYENMYNLVGPGPATFYRDACKLMDKETDWHPPCISWVIYLENRGTVAFRISSP